MDAFLPADICETVADSARRTMMDAGAMTSLRAASVVRRLTGAKITALSLNDAGGTHPAWLLECDRLDAPEMFTDAGLIEYATKLEHIFG